MTTAKQQLRQAMAAEKAMQPAEVLAEKSAAIVAKLLTHPKLCQAQTIMLYHSLPDEVALEAVLAKLYGHKTLLLPKVRAQGLSLHRYVGEELLRQGAYHIQEPTTPPFERWETIDTIVVPGVAFDSEGHRLGRGKGYYDRLLASMAQRVGRLPYLLGVCFDFQLLAAVPHTTHDYCMDEVVTNGV